MKHRRFDDYNYLRKTKHRMEDDLYDFKRKHPDDRESLYQLEYDLFTKLLSTAKRL